MLHFILDFWGFSISLRVLFFVFFMGVECKIYCQVKVPRCTQIRGGAAYRNKLISL